MKQIKYKENKIKGLIYAIETKRYSSLNTVSIHREIYMYLYFSHTFNVCHISFSVVECFQSFLNNWKMVLTSNYLFDSLLLSKSSPFNNLSKEFRRVLCLWDRIWMQQICINKQTAWKMNDHKYFTNTKIHFKNFPLGSNFVAKFHSL